MVPDLRHSLHNKRKTNTFMQLKNKKLSSVTASINVSEMDNKEISINTFGEQSCVKNQTLVTVQSLHKDVTLDHFSTGNRYGLLVDNAEEDVFKIIRRNMVKDTPRKSLKKCRYCNYKKRTCFIDSFSCKARQRKCTLCNKRGHYPQSLNCKERKVKFEEKVLKDAANLHRNLHLLNKSIKK